LRSIEKISTFLFETAVYRLEVNRYQSGVILELLGDIEAKFE
jgi:hypothetical protein